MELDNETRYKMYQALAHEICHRVHPEFQINMTGMAYDGVFLVSCATHKMIATRIVDAQVEHELGVDSTVTA